MVTDYFYYLVCIYAYDTDKIICDCDLQEGVYVGSSGPPPELIFWMSLSNVGNLLDCGDIAV